MLDGLLDEPSNNVESVLLEGLFEIPERTRLQGFDRVLGCVVARHHDTGQIGLDFMDLADELEAVDAGHLNIAEHEIDRCSRDQLECFDRIRGHQDVIADAPQDALDRAAIEFLVIDDENVVLLQG